MKRAALLLAFGAAPLVLLLFPAARRFLARKARFVLLILAGAILTGGLSTIAVGPRFGQLTSVEAALTIGGVVLLLGSFLAVLWDGLRRRHGNFPPR
jgi:hypothetical protein